LLLLDMLFLLLTSVSNFFFWSSFRHCDLVMVPSRIAWIF